MSLEVVFFEIRGRRCALPVASVREVLAAPNLTPVPHAPPGVRGVAPVHGQALPLVDLGVWMSTGTDARVDPSMLRTGAEQVLLIEHAQVNAPPVRIALAVDRVMRLGTIDEEHSRPPPAGPPFVVATVLDVEGPALLLDAAGAIDHVRQAIRAVVRS